MFNEDFQRCSECEHPYFKKETKYVLAREREEIQQTIVQKEITYFACDSCGAQHTPVYREEAPELYSSPWR